jgi:hypothetical protein
MVGRRGQRWAVSSPRAGRMALGEASSSPSICDLALGETSLPRVLREGTRETNYFVYFFCFIFFVGAYNII